MFPLLIPFFLLTASTIPFPVSPSPSFPDRFLKPLPSSLLSSHKPQEYLEITHPLTPDRASPACTHPIIHHSFADTINQPPFSTPYSPPPDCLPPWTQVVLEFSASCRGEQYDRIAGLWLGAVELFRTSTAEPTKHGIFWKVRKDVTRYSSLLVQEMLNVTMMLENVVDNDYTGVYHVDVSLLFYKQGTMESSRVESDQRCRAGSSVIVEKSTAVEVNSRRGLYQRPADLIIPISDDGEKGFWFRIESDSDVRLKRIRIPRNTHRLLMELYVSFHGNDEFYYSNPPNSYVRLNNLTTGRANGAYREVFVTIDGKFAGSELLFPVVFAGGINPLLWEPVVAIGAFNLPSYDLDLTPFLGTLVDGKVHEFGIGVSDGISYWLVDANLHFWLDHGVSKVQAKSVVYQNPAIDIERREGFKQLDGWFKIKAKRKTRFAGWVKSSAGNLTTIVLHEFKFRNKIKFQGGGNYKIVNQKINAEREVRVETDVGNLVGQVVMRRRYPLNLVAATLPARRKGTYTILTNFSHELNEKYSNGDYSKAVNNLQDSKGWMEVRDHSVISGEGGTNQSVVYRGNNPFGCFVRSVSTAKGRLMDDYSSYRCPSVQ